jgi:SAM-dependent methyltransferase
MYSFDVLNLRKGMRFRKKFDVIFAANVFHHISTGLRRHAMEQIYEALKPSGLFFLFEHNPYNPLVVRIVRECPFDKGVILIKPAHARKLFSSARLKVERQAYYFFFPRSLSFLRWSEKFMGYIPFGAQYMLVGRKR